jgi:uncharacterized protein (TIGR02145 family)
MLFLFLYIIYIPAARTQVTIGSTLEPVNGALLDLKETDKPDGTDNSTKGLALPRVNLTNLTPATPMELSVSIGGTGDWDLNTHIGLIVYNVNNDQCSGILQGTYVWAGTQWQPVSPAANIRMATPDETSGANTWGTAVVRHQAKTGVYEEFYSADFGSEAGRWMTTNLAATAYDGITHSADRTLTGPTANSGNPNNTAYWCYPNGGSGGATATDYNNNPHIGYLYTWDAATAGKGEANGQGNNINEGANNTYARVQGVCPAGWHLPSDYEWTELENAIIKNTISYADVSANIDPGDNSALLQQNSTTGWRGTMHGQVMKDVCGLNGSNPNGTSKSLNANGFSVLLAGLSISGSTNFFGTRAYFWSSSSNITNSAWGRYLSDSYTSVNRSSYTRSNLHSVRCKKD